MVLSHTLDGHGTEHVILLHDWLGDSTTYDPAIPYFDPDRLTCARIDLPGYGASRAHPLDPGALGTDVLAVASQLGWTRFHLVAHSMSTVIAQRLARSVPERIASVTLVTPVTPGTAHPDELVAALRAVGLDPARRRGAFEGRWGLSARWLAWKLERWAAAADPEAVAAYVDLFARPELPTTRAPTGVPVLAITGIDDAPHFSHAVVEIALRAVYPDVVVVECPASHYPMQETPPLFASIVERFVLEHQ